MRVVHIIKVTRIAGAERHLLILLQGLRACGIEVRLLMLVEPANPVPQMDALSAEYGIPLERFVITADYDARLIGRLRARLRQLKPHIVHTHLIHADIFGVLAARLAGVPLVIMGRHNDDAFRRRRPLRALHAVLWHIADGGIVISSALAHFVQTIEYAPSHKVRVVPYGLPSRPPLTAADRAAARARARQAWGGDDEALVIGMACRLMPQKGVTFALRALALCSRDFPHARLVIAGDGPLRQTLEDQARQLGIRERVHFLGWVEDVPRLMLGFDIFLMPSLWEGFGLVLLEAMQARLPTVASYISAIPEIVAHGETGLLVLPSDAEGLASALHILCADRALRQHMGLLAEDRLEQHFTAQRMVAQTAHIYEDWLAQRGKGA